MLIIDSVENIRKSSTHWSMIDLDNTHCRSLAYKINKEVYRVDPWETLHVNVVILDEIPSTKHIVYDFW